MVDGKIYKTATARTGVLFMNFPNVGKVNCTFLGWEAATPGLEIKSFPGISNSYLFVMPATDVVIIANFKCKEYNLIYKVDGEVYETVSVEYGSAITLLDEPVKEGYTFSGWSEAPATMPANEVEVIGSFNVNSYNLVYKVDGEVYETVSVEYGADIELLPEPVKEGYTFSGWSEAPPTMPAKDVEISGSFNVNSYNLVYKVDGEVYENISVEYGSEIELLPEPTKAGYTFSGWIGAPVFMPAEDVEVHGWFEILTSVVEVEAEISDDTIYNLKGQRLVNLRNQPPGVYVVGGKKVRITSVQF
jgi:hypothetical protein